MGLLLWKIRQVFAGFPARVPAARPGRRLDRHHGGGARALRPGAAAHGASATPSGAATPPRWSRCSGRRSSSPTGPSGTRPSSCTPISPTTRRRIPDLVRRIESGADLVVAEGRLEGEPSAATALVRRYAPLLLRGVVSVPGVRDIVSGFAIFRLVALRNAIRSQRGPPARDRWVGGQRRAVLAGGPLRPAGGDGDVGRAARPRGRAQPRRGRGTRRTELWRARAARCAPRRSPPAPPSPRRGASARPRRCPRDQAARRWRSRCSRRAARPRPRHAATIRWPSARRSPTAPSSGMLTLGVGHAAGGRDRHRPGRGDVPLPVPARRARRSFYSLDDVLESWVGTETSISRRFVQDFVENDKPKHRHYEIYPDSGFFREGGKPDTEPTPRRTRWTTRPSSTSSGSRRSRWARSTPSTATSGRRRTRSPSRW